MNDDDLVYIPYQLAKDIAKRPLNFDNLTREGWGEIRKWFYMDRYGEFPEDTKEADA